MIKVKDGYAKLIGTTASGSASRVLLSNGGDHVLGNANGNIPLNNGTVSTNLNADMLDGLHIHTGRNNEVNKVVRTDASGYILAGWINTTSGDMGTTAATRIYCSNDGYIRYKTPANFFNILANDGNQISITVGSQNRKLTINYATNADMLDGLHWNSFARWYGDASTDSTAKDVTATSTADFFAKIHATSGLFNSRFGAMRGSWWYVGNTLLNTGVGTLEMAGTAVLNLGSYADTNDTYKSLLFLTAYGDLYSYASEESGVATWSRYSKEGHSHRVTKLHRSDGSDDYYLRHYWTGSYWHLQGYYGSSYHAGVQVAYADWAGGASSVTVSNSDSNSTYRMVWHSGNTLYSTNNIYCNPSADLIYSAGFRHVSYNSASYLLRSDGGAAGFHWSGLGGQPTWLWGGNSQHTYYVYNPSNFNVNSAAKLRVVSCYNGTTNNDLWSTIKSSNSSYLGTSTMYEVYNDGGPTTYGHILDTVTVHSKHWQSQLWMAAGKGGRLYYRNKDYNNDTWGNWGTVAWTSDIPTVTNYYWANVKVSASSSTGTTPTFSTCYTSNWFRSTGSTGWYSESYGGGIHMSDSTWVRTYNGKSFYCSAIILAGNRIYTGYDSGEANSISCSNWFRSNGTSGWYNPTYGCHVYPNASTTYGGLMLRGEKGGYTGFILGTNTNYMNLMDNGTDKGLYQEGKLWILYYNRSNNYVGIRTSSLSYPLTINGDSYTNGWSRAANGFYVENTGVHYTSLGSVGAIQVTSNNEFIWGSSNDTLYFNYRATSRGSTVSHYIWNAGSSSSYANHTVGKVLAQSTPSSWLDGQRYERGGFNLMNATDTGSYWPWFRQTLTAASKWISVGTLGNSLYFIGSATSRTANSYDYGFRMDFSNGYLYGNFSGYLSGTASYASNADAVDGQHFNWNNNKNDHTYLWAASSSGLAYLVHRASMSVNYATYARYVYCTSGSYLNFQWSGQGGLPTWLFGSNDGANVYVWNPSNFNVNSAAVLRGNASNPNNSHPGHGAKVFYSWNTGLANNASSGYSNGITIGSHPNDTSYGFQIVQNMWDDRTYTRRYNGGWLSWKTLAWTSDIPSVGNGTVAIYLNGTHKGSFSMNQSGNTNIYLTDNNTTYSFAPKGSATQGIYLAGTNTFAAMTYSLKATVNSGTSGKLAYYSGANAISAYTSTRGDYYKPIYLSGGVPIECYSRSIGSVTWGTNCSGYIQVKLFGPIVILQGYFTKINVNQTSSTNYVFKLPTGTPSPATTVGITLSLEDGYENDRNTIIMISGQYGYCNTGYNSFNPKGWTYYFSACYMA